MKHKQNDTDTILLKVGEGRTYYCGTMTVIFKADENETAGKYSILEMVARTKFRWAWCSPT